MEKTKGYFAKNRQRYNNKDKTLRRIESWTNFVLVVAYMAINDVLQIDFSKAFLGISNFLVILLDVIVFFIVNMVSIKIVDYVYYKLNDIKFSK